MDEIREYEKLEGSALNKVKELLAYEVTKLVHGEEEAKKAQQTATAIFSGMGDANNMPSAQITKDEISDGIGILDLLAKVEFIPSKGEGRRLIQQGGLSIDNEKVTAIDMTITADSFKDGKIVVKKGNKSFLKIELS